MPTPSQLSFCDLATRYDALSQNGDPVVLLASPYPLGGLSPSLESRPWPLQAAERRAVSL